MNLSSSWSGGGLAWGRRGHGSRNGVERRGAAQGDMKTIDFRVARLSLLTPLVLPPPQYPSYVPSPSMCPHSSGRTAVTRLSP